MQKTASLAAGGVLLRRTLIILVWLILLYQIFPICLVFQPLTTTIPLFLWDYFRSHILMSSYANYIIIIMALHHGTLSLCQSLDSIFHMCWALWSSWCWGKLWFISSTDGEAEPLRPLDWEGTCGSSWPASITSPLPRLYCLLFSGGFPIEEACVSLGFKALVYTENANFQGGWIFGVTGQCTSSQGTLKS